MVSDIGDDNSHNKMHLISPEELVHSSECFPSKRNTYTYSKYVGPWILRILEAECNTSIISVPGAWRTGGMSLKYVLDEPK